jgi:hypothetical protein
MSSAVVIGKGSFVVDNNASVVLRAVLPTMVVAAAVLAKALVLSMVDDITMVGLDTAAVVADTVVAEALHSLVSCTASKLTCPESTTEGST